MESRRNILCYVVAYNAAPFITQVLEAIPEACWNNERYAFEVLISDDCSTDATLEACERFIAASPRAISVTRTPYNLGYGGNQKHGYDYVLARDYDAVVLLHGDGQYDPRLLPALLEPILQGKADVVLGSRMMQKGSARSGGMPRYKIIGNRVLTWFQNRLLGSRLSEFHTGLRAYRTAALAAIPYAANSNGYVFDTEILIQCIAKGFTIAEISIPTHYGDEPCHVNGLKYGWRVICATLAWHLHRLGLTYKPQYDGLTGYPSKTAFESSHRFALQHAAGARTVLDIGAGEGYISEALRRQGKHIIGIDFRPAAAPHYHTYIQADLDHGLPLERLPVQADTVLLLDVLEHLRQPEKLLADLRGAVLPDARLIITVPNVAFLSVRLLLLLGFFSYSSRGIMDYSHLRFFTFGSIKKLLKAQGYCILSTHGIPAPFPLLLPWKGLAKALLALNHGLIFIHKGLFSFQIALIVAPKAIAHDS